MALLDKLEMAEEIPEEFDQDPKPDEKPKRRQRRPRTPAPKVAAPRQKTVAAMAKDVGNDIATMLEMTSVVWGVRDQCCAPVLAEQSKDIGHALAAILARNPELLRRFAQAETGVFVMQCLALGQALLPVGKVIVQNHVLKQGEGDSAPVVDINGYPVFSGSNGAYPA